MLVRIVILIIAPPMLCWTFVATFWREARRAPWYAWNDCMGEVGQIKAAWRAKSINPENWK